MQLRSLWFAIAAVLLGGVAVINAHHSAAGYDQQREVSIKGAIAKYEWANPHIYIHVLSADTLWEVEAGAPGVMRTRGWSPNTFAQGEAVVVTVHPARDSTRRTAQLVSVQKTDGTVLGMGAFANAASRSPVTARSLAGTWATIVNAPAGRGARGDVRPSLPLTKEGRDSVARFNEQTSSIVDCVPPPAPSLMTVPDLKVIEIRGQIISVRAETWGVERTIRMNVRNHDGVPSSLQGHSIGHWEGESLVVETARFSPAANGNGAGISSGPDKRLLERFTLNPDRTSLTYRYVLEDRQYLTAPLTGDRRWAYRPDLRYSPERCDPTNARRFRGY